MVKILSCWKIVLMETSKKQAILLTVGAKTESKSWLRMSCAAHSMITYAKLLLRPSSLDKQENSVNKSIKSNNFWNKNRCLPKTNKVSNGVVAHLFRWLWPHSFQSRSNNNWPRRFAENMYKLRSECEWIQKSGEEQPNNRPSNNERIKRWRNLTNNPTTVRL